MGERGMHRRTFCWLTIGKDGIDTGCPSSKDRRTAGHLLVRL